MNIIKRIKTAIRVLTHRHCFCLTYNCKMTNKQLSEEVLNAGCIMFLGHHCNDLRKGANLYARADMVKAALNDNNVTMQTEQDGKYYIIRDCESEEMVNTLNNLELKE